MKKASLLAGCLVLSACSPKIIERVEVKERTKYIKDTAYIDVFLPQERIEVIKIDSSHLETDYALTDAWTDSVGLHHTLSHKTVPVETKVIYEKEIVYRDSLIYKEKKVEVPVEVPAKLNWWQRIRMDGFYIVGGILMLIIAFRKAR